jgi:hypothetical protein
MSFPEYADGGLYVDGYRLCMPSFPWPVSPGLVPTAESGPD